MEISSSVDISVKTDKPEFSVGKDGRGRDTVLLITIKVDTSLMRQLDLQARRLFAEINHNQSF